MNRAQLNLRIVGGVVLVCMALAARGAEAETGDAKPVPPPATPSAAMESKPQTDQTGQLRPEGGIAAIFGGRGPAGWLDPHGFGPLGEVMGRKFPVPEGLDPGKIPGWDGPDREPPPSDDISGCDDYWERQRRSDIACWPEVWDPATRQKVDNWGGRDPFGSYYCELLWNYQTHPGGSTRKGGDPGMGKDTGGGSSDDNQNDSNTNGGTQEADDKPQADGQTAEVMDNQNESKPDGERDSDPEGDDPDELKSPAVGEGLAPSAASLLPGPAGFDPAEAAQDGIDGEPDGPGSTRDRNQTESEYRKRRPGGPTLGPGDIDRPDEVADSARSGLVDGAIADGGHTHQPGPEPGGGGDDPDDPRASDGRVNSGSLGLAAYPSVGNGGGPSDPGRPNAGAGAAGVVTDVRGSVQRLLVADGQARWVPLKAGDRLGEADVVRTGLRSGAALAVNGATVHIGSATKLGVGRLGRGPNRPARLRLAYGSVGLGRAGAGANVHVGTSARVGAEVHVQTPAGSARMSRATTSVKLTRAAGLKLRGPARTSATAQVAAPGTGLPRPLAAGGVAAPKTAPKAMKLRMQGSRAAPIK